MIKVENINTYGIARAIYSARNAMNSWDKSDSDLDKDILGEADLQLAKRLAKAGPEHRKFLRQIFVTMDITAPLYWWKEMDTYKVGTTANSCSTMHTITKKEFAPDDFSHEHLLPVSFNELLNKIELLNQFRNIYVNGILKSGEEENSECKTLKDMIGVLLNSDGILPPKNKIIWWQIIQLLPSSYNQKRTVSMNYENVVNIINQREEHKLDEWRKLCDILKDLPHINAIMGR